VEVGSGDLHPAPGLLERHARHGTAQTALISQILSLLAPPAGDVMRIFGWRNAA
jgi:hypothetical protein